MLVNSSCVANRLHSETIPETLGGQVRHNSFEKEFSLTEQRWKSTEAKA